MSEFLSRTIAVDIETVGELPEYALQAYRYNGDTTYISAVSYAWVDESGLHTNAFLKPDTATMQSFFDRFADRRWVGWNVCFDVSWFQAAGLDVSRLKWLDAMLLWMHSSRVPEKDKGKRKSYALKSAMEEFYPEHAGFKNFEDFQTADPEQLQQLLNRNRMDAAFTLKLAYQFWSQLTPEQRNAAVIEAACIPMVAHTFNQGLCIDVAAGEELKTDLKATAEDILADLIAKSPEVANVDLGSPKQLGDLLFNQWGLTPPKQTDKGANSTDKEALTDLAEVDPRAKQLQLYREAVNTLAKFVESPLGSVEYNGDGRTRPQAKIFGTYTGRMTYYSKQGKGKTEKPTGIAIHQWPRDKRFRKLIVPPEGYTLMEFDFAGQEFRWMAVASGDDTMLGLCAPGEDPHSYMGSKVAGVGYGWLKESSGTDSEAKKTRNLGKFSNLSFQYRIGAASAQVKAKTQYGLKLEKHFVQGLIDTYKKTYIQVPRYWNTQIYKCSRLNYAETYAGRRVDLSQVSGWERDSAAINYPIQGTGADQKYLALAVARNMLPTFGAHLYMELHDGVFFIAKNEKACYFYAALKKALSDLPYKQAWGRAFPIQFPVDAKASSLSWGDLKEVPEWDS